MASFGPIAPHYDLLMANVPYDMWAGYYRLLLAQLESQPHRLLDVCCGTGVMAELLTKEGFDVTGFDLAPAMIAEAQNKAMRSDLPITYRVADATTFDFGETYQGAYSFFDSLNYITTFEGVTAAIHRVAAHLEPGATFIFDVNTAYAFEQQMFDQSDLRRRALIRYQWEGQYDPETRIIEVQMSFWRGDEQFQEVHVQRAHRHEEIMQALRDAGFASVHVFDSYTLDPPRKKSDRLHYAAKFVG